ncbi:hypothetical protein FQB35_09005 [Crassaminicella thermophila]|uniref:Uncharacterized protein n=2 Tax=Crassaminicella thermophila TaxID=2599308 RepID=A0A5C0SFE9_CRATE|nr:hypothetical protein FQB35_09005 [Crassaminicella thermophila]
MFKCPYFKSKFKNDSETTKYIIDYYCKCNYLNCIRYIAMMNFGENKIPNVLRPTKKDWIKHFITDK